MQSSVACLFPAPPISMLMHSTRLPAAKKDAREDCCMGDPEHATLKLGERGVRAWRRRVLRVRFRIPQPARPIVA